MAKRFTFRLQTLLRVRDLHEQEAQRKVGLKLAEIARLDQLDRQTHAEIQKVQQRLVDQQSSAAFDPRALTAGRAWVAQLRRTLFERDAIRREKQSELSQLQESLREARKQKRIIEKLRERRAAEHRKQSDQAEQRAADELAQTLHRREAGLTFRAASGAQEA